MFCLRRHKKKRSVGDVPGGKGGSAAAGWANGGQEKSFSPEDLDVPRVEPLFKKQKRKMKTEEITLEKVGGKNASTFN